MNDPVLQETCQAIVRTVAQAIDAEPDDRTVTLRVPGGIVAGKQITVDATGKDGLLSMARLSVLNPALAPEGEVVRIEYEHDKETKHGTQRVYSIQSVRKKGGELVLMENFLADTPATVRDQDFSEVQSEVYARDTVLKTVNDWSKWRAWQLQEARKPH